MPNGIVKNDWTSIEYTTVFIFGAFSALSSTTHML